MSSGVQPDDIFSEFLKAGIILEECLTLDNIAHLNRIIKTSNISNNFSIFFNNIDGNQTNFDTLSIDLDRHDCKFSAITLCETNVDSFKYLDETGPVRHIPLTHWILKSLNVMEVVF